MREACHNETAATTINSLYTIMPARKRTVLLVDVELGGHHGAYLLWMSRALAEAGHQVDVAVPTSALGTAAGKVFKISVAGIAKMHEVSSRKLHARRFLGSSIMAQFEVWRFYRDVLHEIELKVDVVGVVVPFLPSAIYAIAALGSPFGTVPWVGVDMRSSFHFKHVGVRAPSTFTSFLSGLAFRRILGIASTRAVQTIDPSLMSYVSINRGRNWTKVCYLPDPVSTVALKDKVICRRFLNIPEEAFVVLLYGSVSSRKGLEFLLNGLIHERCPRNVCALVAGEQDAAARELCRQPTGQELRRQRRLFEIDRFLTSDEEATTISVADLVWLGYQRHYQMSGVLAQAGILGIPVIACNEGLIGWLTKRNKTGAVMDVKDPLVVAEYLASVSKAASASQSMPSSSHGVYQAHAVDVVQRGFVEQLTKWFALDGRSL